MKNIGEQRRAPAVAKSRTADPICAGSSAPNRGALLAKDKTFFTGFGYRMTGLNKGHRMSEHKPIPPVKAIEVTEAAGLPNAKAILADYAAAGLIKTYALIRQTASVGGELKTVRDAQIPNEVWQRIVAENKVCDALNGGTIRLQGSHLRGGESFVQITGISFSEASLANVLERYCRTSRHSSVSSAKPSPTPPSSQLPDKDPSPIADDFQSKKVPPPIKPGDLLASIAQTKQVTGLGRTTVDKLIKQGIFVKKDVGRRTLVTVESIERFSGVNAAAGSRASKKA